MEKRILTYRKYIDELLHDNKERDWEKLMEEHLVQVGFFQHERLIHLIVTVLFALMEVLAVCTTVAVFNPFLGILDVLIMVLLIPYVRHYYILENEVQKMYGQYDVMLNKVHEAFRMNQ
ncbi:MAG: hypothetical protein II994_09280 [Lachnospiraceae bacterium]|nr:hypothetical protein [Lachnospiraceae bacterium]